MSMYFFDEDPMSLPNDAQYYFNICVTTIAIHPQCAEQYLGANVEEAIYTEQITSPRPRVYYFYIDDELDEDMEYEIENFPHCVVEISKTLGVAWWEMIDFDTNDLWRIDLE